MLKSRVREIERHTARRVTKRRLQLFATTATLLGLSFAATAFFGRPGGAGAQAQGPQAPSPIELTEGTLHALRTLPAITLGETTLDESSVLHTAPQSSMSTAFLDRSLIDDFESDTWPDRARWPLVSDLAATALPGSGFFWAPSECESSVGFRSLRASGGGEGTTLACDSGYPADMASSALLYLDLRDTLRASVLELRFDAWLDADPDEGLMVSYITFDASGTMDQRRILHTATGRSGSWWRGISLDLTTLSDRLDPTWSHDLRGRRAYLEMLFISHDGSVDGRGAFLDNMTIDVEIPPTPTASPTPPPTATPSPTPTVPPTDVDRVNACLTLSDCDSLTIRAYTDYGCDGRYQAGVDSPLSGKRIRLSADLERLGAELGRSGLAVFRFPHAASVEAELDMPAEYEMCPGLTNPMSIAGRRFTRTGRASLSFRVRRIR